MRHRASGHGHLQALSRAIWTCRFDRRPCNYMSVRPTAPSWRSCSPRSSSWVRLRRRAVLAGRGADVAAHGPLHLLSAAQGASALLHRTDPGRRGSWGWSAVMLRATQLWRAQHPEERLPLAAYGYAATIYVWLLATIAVAAEMLFLLIPWSLGWTPTVDPVLARILFWWFGRSDVEKSR
jgi:hypothetical protein